MNKKTMTFLLGCLTSALITMQAQAQQPIEHEFIRGDMPPGVAARFYQMSDPALRGKIQPVQLVAPANTTIEVGDAQSSFGQPRINQMTINMGLGYVYRFKLSNFPQPDAAGKTLYPSIEVIGKLNPPAGLEKDFPVQVVVTRNDIDVALAGRMVTRVIYLEDPRGTLPHLHTTTDQPSVDVRRGQDALRAAEKMGRPMAILRMGSRVPLEGEVAEWFTFGVAAPTVLADPRPVNDLGLSDRELKIVDEMRQAELAAKAEANEEKPAVPVRRADFSSNASARPAPSIGIIARTSATPDADIQAAAATMPVSAATPKAKKPRWVAVKANATPKTQVNRSTRSNMKPLRAFTKATTKAQPPAPSMVGLDVVSAGPSRFKEPARAYPVLRLPNEL